MKWYHWVLIAIGGYLLFFRRKGTTATLAAGHPEAGAQIHTIVFSQDPGNSAQYDTDPNNYELVSDQVGYPGWYRSRKDGSWYNPDTKDFYSAGSSPARIVGGAYDQGTMQRPDNSWAVNADTNQYGVTADQAAETHATGRDFVF